MSLPILLRNYAIEVSITTKRSLQDVLGEIIKRLQRGETEFSSEIVCVLCASKNTRITHTSRDGEMIVRSHKCDFCNGTFKSIERKSGKIPEKPLQRLVKKRKK